MDFPGGNVNYNKTGTDKKGRSSTASTIIAKIYLLSVLSLFLFLLYMQEKEAMNYISENLSTPDQYLINKYLYRLESGFLPGQFWRLFWPLAIVSTGLIFFDKWRMIFLSIVGALSSLLLLANVIHYDFFSSIITISSLTIADQLLGVSSCITNKIRLEHVFNISIFFIFTVAGIFYNRFHDSSFKRNLPSFAVDKAMGVICALLAFYSFFLAFNLQTKTVLFKKEFNGQYRLIVLPKNAETPEADKGALIALRYLTSPRGYALTFGLFNFYFKDLMDRLFDSPLEPLSANQLVKISNQLERKYETNQISSPFAGKAAGRNIFLIDVESFHPFLWDLSIDGAEVTPTLNRLRRDALCWDYTLDHTGRGSSSDAEFAVINGLLPMYWLEKITAVEVPRRSNLLTLPRELKSYGYKTLSFHGYYANFWSRSINHPLWGIDSMYFKKSFETQEKIGMGIPDETVFLRSLDVLKEQKDPFFAYIISLSTHYPYSDVPEKYQDYFIDRFPAGSEAIRYLQLMRYVDDALKGFFQKAKQCGLWDNSVFVIYGDHPPHFSKETFGMIKQSLRVSLQSIQERRVPLIILMPGHEKLIAENKMGYSKVIGGLCDIFPTVMHLIGKEIPYGIYGTHLFVHNKDREPMPTHGGYVYNEILYSGIDGVTIKEGSRILYTGNKDVLVTDSGLKRMLYTQVADVLNLHLQIFTNNAQEKAIIYETKRNGMLKQACLR